jgi:hypothetical protein
MIQIEIGGDNEKNKRVLGVLALDSQAFPSWSFKTPEFYFKLHERHPDGFIFAFDTLTQQMVGYILALPVNREYFERTLKPDFDETDLTPDKIEDLKVGPNLFYAAGIVVRLDRSDRVLIFRKLMKAYSDYLASLFLDNKMYVSEMSSIAVSKVGMGLCDQIGMTKICPADGDHGTIYCNRNFYKSFKYDQISKLDDKLEILKELRRRHNLKEQSGDNV